MAMGYEKSMARSNELEAKYNSMSPIELKRAELAKKKRQIIRGQNTQTAAAAKASAGTSVGSGPLVI